MADTISADSVTDYTTYISNTSSSGSISIPSNTSGSISSNSYIYTQPSYTTAYTVGGLNEDEVKDLFNTMFQQKEKELKKEIENSYISVVGEYFWVNNNGEKQVVHVVDRKEDNFVALAPSSIGFRFITFTYEQIDDEAEIVDWIGQEKEIYKKQK